MLTLSCFLLFIFIYTDTEIYYTMASNNTNNTGSINYLEQSSPYDYTPDLATGLAFTIIFTLLTVAHCGLAIKYRYWVSFFALIPGGILEILGWGGRVWSHYSVLNSDPFIMQMCW